MKPTKFELFLNQLSKDIAVGRADQGVLEDFFVACGLWNSNNQEPAEYRIG
jgi:hypothetical protein